MTTTIIAVTAAAVSTLALVWVYRAVLADINRPIAVDDFPYDDEGGDDTQDLDLPYVAGEMAR